MSIFKGAGVAIVTPMKNNEEVNYDRLEQMIEYQINQGTDCIIIAGTTGELYADDRRACRGDQSCC